MKKALFINYGNSGQLTWWTKRGSKICGYKHLVYICDKNTGKAVGEFVELTGLFAKKILKEGSKFHGKGKKIVIKVEK